MCRLAAYLGEPLFLETLIAKRRHSLMRQSLHADHSKAATNGDGFGVGWYGDRAEPGVYREVMPAWSDDNLLALSQTVSSRLFFAHVPAATAGGIARQNCHPFRHGRYLFMHNGQVGGYAQVRRTMEGWLPNALFAERRGATDAELLFLLIMARMQRGVPVAEAVVSVLDDTVALMQEQGADAPLRCAAELADGERLIAFRIASDDHPAPHAVPAPLRHRHHHRQRAAERGRARLAVASQRLSGVGGHPELPRHRTRSARTAEHLMGHEPRSAAPPPLNPQRERAGHQAPERRAHAPQREPAGRDHEGDQRGLALALVPHRGGQAAANGAQQRQAGARGGLSMDVVGSSANWSLVSGATSSGVDRGCVRTRWARPWGWPCQRRLR